VKARGRTGPIVTAAAAAIAVAVVTASATAMADQRRTQVVVCEIGLQSWAADGRVHGATFMSRPFRSRSAFPRRFAGPPQETAEGDAFETYVDAHYGKFGISRTPAYCAPLKLWPRPRAWGPVLTKWPTAASEVSAAATPSRPR
jgi:hypothetical protein